MSKRKSDEVKGIGGLAGSSSTQNKLKFTPKKRKAEEALNATQVAKQSAKAAGSSGEVKISAEEAAWLASLPKLSSAFAELLPQPTLFLPEGESNSEEQHGASAAAVIPRGKQGLLLKEWRDILAPEFKRKYWVKLCVELDRQASLGVRIIPSISLIFSALNLCPPNDVRVVIIAQDPYPRPQHACGVALSVPHGTPPPPSLEVVFEEIKRDIPDFKIPHDGCLDHWCSQGILLLNCILTTIAGVSNAHKELEWEKFTNAVVSWIGNRKTDIPFLLWGYAAQQKLMNLTSFPFKKHFILKAGHPSPKHTGGMNPFIGCRHFSKTNGFLKSKGKVPIVW